MGRAPNMHGEKRSLYGILVGKNEGKRKFGRPWRRLLLLKWNFRKWDGCAWNGLIWLRIGTGGGLL
jgi:hypothetical protein